jgi:hypothetical protein
MKNDTYKKRNKANRVHTTLTMAKATGNNKDLEPNYETKVFFLLEKCGAMAVPKLVAMARRQ